VGYVAMRGRVARRSAVRAGSGALVLIVMASVTDGAPPDGVPTSSGMQLRQDLGSPPGRPLPMPLDPAVATMVEQAKADLARRNAVTPGEIALVDVRSVMWPDTGLGCPRPGVGYLQVPQDGFLIRLTYGGRTLHYHQGRGRPPFLCEAPG